MPLTTKKGSVPVCGVGTLSHTYHHADMPQVVHDAFQAAAAKHGVNYDKEMFVDHNADCVDDDPNWTPMERPAALLPLARSYAQPADVIVA